VRVKRLGASIAEVRAEEARAATIGQGPVEPVGDTVDRSIAGVPVRVYRPAGTTVDPLPMVVHLHGGGFVFGSLATHDGVCRHLCARTGALVISVGYRLAPEYAFPCGLNDCWAVIIWLVDNAGELGGDPGRIAVGGDSAGGGLAAVAARRARDQEIPLKLQFLVYPTVDFDVSGSCWAAYGEGYGLSAEGMEWYRDQYLPNAADRKHPDAVPILADSVAGVAPAHVVTVEFDPTRDSSERYAERLHEEGVAVTLKREAGLIHGCYRIPALIPGGRVIVDGVVARLRHAFEVSGA
jgi:acetyl esterase